MRTPGYCDDCFRRKNCGIKAGLDEKKIVECTNKNYTAPQESEEAGDTDPQQTK
jgi:hypothetical protein